MKSIITVILCFVTCKAFCQTNEIVVQEKSSNWIKVLSTPTVPTPKKTATVRKQTNFNKPSVPKRNEQEEFEKTNSQVNRFKKAKKD